MTGEMILIGSVCVGWALYRTLRLELQVKARTQELQGSLDNVQASQHTLQSFFDSSPQLMGLIEIVDEDILHIADNLAAAQFFGQSPEYLRLKRSSELGASADQIDLWLKHYRLAQSRGQPVRFEYEHRGAGKINNFSSTVNFIGAGQSGNPRFSYCVNDVTEQKQALQKLAVSEERLKFALEGANDGLWDWDLAKGTVYFSPRWTGMLGYEPSEIRGHADAWSTLLHPDDAPQVMERLTAHLEGRAPDYEVEQRLKTKQGGWKWILARGKVTLRDPVTGQPLRMVGTHTDISVQKQVEHSLRQSEKRQRDLMQFAPVGIFLTNADGHCTFVNHWWTEITGLRAEQALGYGWSQATCPADRDRVMTEWIESVEQKREFSLEYRFRRPDGEDRWVIGKAIALRDTAGQVVEFLGSIQDITEAKRIRDQLVEANHAALAAARTKSEFLANMSHEIRTPMNGVIGMCNLLLDSATDPAQIARLQIIHQSSDLLLELINGILDFSKLEAGKIEIELNPVRPHAAAQDVVDLLGGLAAQKNLRLSYAPGPDVPEWVLGDITRLRQILMNLVSNALKFTSQGGVQVSSQARRLEDGRFEIQFSVRDTGIGIPPSARDRLFSPFSQVDASTTRRFGGTGLGLVISKGLCEKMGGRIWVESQTNQGSTFSFTFLAAESAAWCSLHTERGWESADPEFAKRHPWRVLIAEDNRTNQIVLTALLEKLGYAADVAQNGREALDLLARRNYDLILMDCHMPQMDGFEATQMIRRQNPRESQPRIVAVTASSMTEDRQRCLDAGMDGFLSKPITLAALMQVLKPSSAPSRPLTLAAPEPVLAVMSEAAFVSNFRGLEEVAQNTIDYFLESLPKLLADIERGLARRDAPALELAAHTFKGVVSNFCAERARAVAGRLEQLARAGDLDAGQAQWQLLQTEAEALKRHLEKFHFARKAA